MRLVRGLNFLAIAALTTTVSVSNIRIEVAAANVLALARQIEMFHPVPRELVGNALDDAGKNEVISSCEDDVSRAVATLRVYLLNQSMVIGDSEGAKSEIGRSALSAVDQRIICSPADGNAWLIRAEILQQLFPDSAEVAASMAMSYRLAKAESWIMGPRFNFALTHFDFVQANLRSEFAADLQLLVEYAPPDVVAVDYVKANDQVRSMITDALAVLPDERRNAVAANVDRQGVTLRMSPTCLAGGAVSGYRGEIFGNVPSQIEICASQ